ncbi:hypothetical protein GW750_06080 [bacterium]|nr:hypothetical protein [bacterium]
MLTQIKKFFHKSLTKSIKATINPQYSITYHIFADFQKKTKNDLMLDMQKLFNVAVAKQDIKTYQKDSISLDLANEFGIKLRPEFTFDAMVVGTNNNFALSAAKAVSEQP